MPFYTVQKTPAPQIYAPLQSNVVALQGQEPQASESGDQAPDDENELPSYDSLLSSPSSFFRPRSVVIDRSLIFPAEPPSDALYQLNHDLDSGYSVTIGRIDRTTSETPGRTPRARIRDRPIYTFSHRIFNDKIIEFTGKRKDGFPYVLMFRSSSIGGSGWKLCSADSSGKEQGPTMLHCKSTSSIFRKSDIAFKWVDAGGKVIAIEGRPVPRPRNPEGKGSFATDPNERDTLNILQPLEQKAVDLLITAWCARVWHDTLESNKTPMTPKEALKTAARFRNEMGGWSRGL